ncbi:far upstream element-binding protein 1-like [Copidosoma floridanum]|uniref:far upstream element-binding protein 1-like n=1 Tax=Copidosoma floridanum TaxID=29053 RepID=UPI0006C978B5|nr:far upstream element-binding protein 1-like [Copidosoma floridanum]
MSSAPLAAMQQDQSNSSLDLGGGNSNPGSTTGSMSDYSMVGPPQTFSQSSAFAAAVQRAKQIAAKINPGGTNNSDPTKKRSLEDGSEPEAKKLAIPDPIFNLHGGMTSGHDSTPKPTATSAPTIPTMGMGMCNEEIKVPDKMVGLIIGRGGEQITRLQAETGCKIQMAAESGGLPERICTLSGTREAVNRARELVLSVVHQKRPDEQIPGANPPYPGPSPLPTTSGNPGLVEIMIPGPKVGLIIGKGGETIKQLQEKSGAKMVVIQEGPGQEQEKPLRITGDPAKVEHAKQLVYELIAEKEMQIFNRSRGFNSEGNPEGVEVTI